MSETVDEQGLYNALDWLVLQQSKTESGWQKSICKMVLSLLYDLTSVWMEGRH